jgi:pSer/pThr/pTyr-binding forkhead associated (FHA) protein
VGDKILARNEPHPLNSGDTIMLGDAKVVFEVQFIPFEQLSKQS